MAWTDDMKEQAISRYQELEPTPENSMEVVTQVAEEMGQSPNGVRMVLSKAGVYVKKEAAASKSSSTKKEGGATSTRVSKEEAHAQLVAALEEAGAEVDMEIISKLTGKAAVYFAKVFASK